MSGLQESTQAKENSNDLWHLRPDAGVTFDRVIAPVGRESFIAEHFTRSFLRVPGFKDKFNSLLSWVELNRILEVHRFEPGRIRLAREGKDIPPNQYLTAGNRAAAIR